jgi:hypothetical protein
MPNTDYPRRRRQPGAVLAAAGLLTALAACGGSGSPPPAAGASGPGAGGALTPGAAGSTAPTPVPSGGGGQSPAATQAPVAAESNPPGDIPDTTVYVTYRSAAGHLLLKVPEGWSRKTARASSTFTSNLNSITVAWMPASAAPAVSSARATTVPALRASTLAFRLQAVRAVTLAGGPAVEIIYYVNSTPNPVTGRQYRLVIERFELYRHGRAAVLDLSSAVGSDNVDPWRIVSESFRWA